MVGCSWSHFDIIDYQWLCRLHNLARLTLNSDLQLTQQTLELPSGHFLQETDQSGVDEDTGSSVGSHQHKMNLVWTLLLLAAATGPAYSQMCRSYQAYEDYFRKTCESECQRKIVPLTFSSISSGLLTIITGLKIDDAKVQNLKIIKQNDGLCLEGGLDLSSRCNEYANFHIKASFKLNIVFSVQNGRPHYSCSSDFAEFKLSFEGLGIVSTLANLALQSIQQVLKKTVYSVFDAVMKTCNDDSSKYSEPFYVGKEDCRYQFNSVKNNGDSFSFAYSVVSGAEEVVNSYHDEYSRPGVGERDVVAIGTPIVSKFFKSCTRGFEIQYPLSDEDCRSLGLVGYDTGLSLCMRIEEAPQCAISSGGFQATAGLAIYIKHGDTPIVHARAVANMNAAVTSTNGYQNIGFSVGAGLSIDADIQQYSVPTGYSCSVNALHSILSAYCGQLQAALNARLNMNVPVPPFAGKPGSRRSCSPKTDCIRCAEYNDGY